MAINIKNEHTAEAVKRLAARRGISYTAAIDQAVAAALAAPDEQAEQAHMDRVCRIAADYQMHLPAGAIPEVDTIYGEDGLYQ